MDGRMVPPAMVRKRTDAKIRNEESQILDFAKEL